MYDIVSANIVHVYTDSFNDGESRLFQAIYTLWQGQELWEHKFIQSPRHCDNKLNIKLQLATKRIN